jgi:uncharacterized glyoxalase superfamily protein PhnB
MVKIHPSLMFSGTCGDAFRRYASLFGGDIVLLLTYAESPLAQHVPPEWRDKVWFARLRAGGLDVTGGDVPPLAIYEGASRLFDGDRRGQCRRSGSSLRGPG